MKIRLIALVGAALALVALAAGCGDDDETSATALTKVEFVKQGNAICEAGNEEIDGEFKEFADENNIDQSKPPTDAQLEEVAEEFLLPSISKQIDEIGALGAPEGEEDAVNAFLDNAEAEVEEVEDDPGLLAGNAFTEVNKEARAIGLVACAEG